MLSTPRPRNSRKNIVSQQTDSVKQRILQHPNLTSNSASLPVKQNAISKNAASATRPRSYVQITLALSVALLSGLSLTGCGGGDATTRIDTTPTPPPVDPSIRTSYNVTVRSPVNLINVKATISDAATGTALGEATIANGNDLVVAVPAAYTKNGNLVVITLSPINSTSSYFDPMLKNGQGEIAAFIQPLHAIAALYQSDVTVRIDPFTEIVYQRALTRAGILITEHAFEISQLQLSAKNLTAEDFSLANNDISLSLGVASTGPFSGFINSINDIAALRIYSTQNNAANPSKVVNSVVSNELIALGQLALYTKNNPSETTPYINFALRAALDLRDGDLDGMTINGGEKLGTAQISSPILYSGVTAPVNSDPNRNSIANLVSDNAALREAHGSSLKQGAISYFNTVNAAAATHFDADTLSYIQDLNYANFTYKSTNPISSRIGAGNFTLAFGFPTGTDFKNLLDASDAPGRANDIMQLNGVYKNNSGCQLNIGYDGTVQLSQVGGPSFSSLINRKSSDSLTRISGESYLLNTTSAELTTPRFVQVRTTGSKVTQVTVGRSAQAVPIQLDSVEMDCTF